MTGLSEVLQVLGAALLGILFFTVLRFRRRGKAAHDHSYAIENVCPHLKPALELLLARGLGVAAVGQKAREFPLEIHLTGPFDPAAVYAELKMEPPAGVSERGVLFCKEDWCEIHPRG